MTTVIKQDGEYSIIKKDAFYEVYKGKEVLKTPNGVVAHTRYLPVAEQLMTDWKEQGYDSYCSPSSLLSYHFTMMEYFASMPKETVDPDPALVKSFGDYAERFKAGLPIERAAVENMAL